MTMMMNGFFESSLSEWDADIQNAINAEHKRQQDGIELIASENIVSQAVMEAQGSVLTNKYAEGYPKSRYYGGCQCVDVVEELAKERACKLFDCKFANVQPHSGSQANQAIFAALLTPGDTLLGMGLDQGGHLTHGHKVNVSGKWFDAHSYGFDPETECLDYEAIRKQALECKPKLIIAGATCYPQPIDFSKFREIANEVGAYLMADIAHISGLVAAGVHMSPLPYADVVTTTTHKTLRGPRGGMILSNNEEVFNKIQKAVFPGIQGGPLMHVIAAKAVAFGEALRPEYKEYAKNVILNAKALAKTLEENGLRVVTGGTENHKVWLDLTPFGLTGKDAEEALDRAGLTCNKNNIPNDPNPPKLTSGLRFGSPAGTTRGFKEAEFIQIGQWIAKVLKTLAEDKQNLAKVEQEVHAEVNALCKKCPIYK